MPLSTEYWFLFPAAIAIATVAMATGIGGAVFFSPLFIIVLRLEPSVAIGTALITELFGFGSGVFAYWRRRLIDFRLGRQLLVFSIPGAIFGTLAADAFPAVVLNTVFGTGIIFIGVQLYLSLRKDEVAELDARIRGEEQHETLLVDRAGNEYAYTIKRPNQGRLFAAIGGAFLGAISVGLAELQEYHLIARCRVPSPVAVATSIFVVVVSVLVASLGHFYYFATSADAGVLSQVLSIVVFTIPGVVLGGQLGPMVQATVDPDRVKLGIAMLFIGVGMFMLFMVL